MALPVFRASLRSVSEAERALAICSKAAEEGKSSRKGISLKVFGNAMDAAGAALEGAGAGSCRLLRATLPQRRQGFWMQKPQGEEIKMHTYRA